MTLPLLPGLPYLPGLAHSPVAGGYVFANAEASALVARFTTPPTNARKALIDTLVGSLKTAGVWSKMDALYVMAAADAQAAQRNWKADAFNLTPNNAPTFTADRGYAGDGATASLSTGAAPNALTLYTQNSAHLSVWVHTFGTGAYITRATAGQPNLLAPSTTNLLARINKASGSDMIRPIASQVGHQLAQRTSSVVVEGYEDGASIGSEGAQTSGARDSSALLLLLGGTHRISVASFGASLSAGEVASYAAALSTYLTAVGAA